MGDFLEAGLPLDRALRTLESVGPGSWRSIIPAVHEAVRRGCPFSDALQQTGTIVPEVATAIIRAGESSGEVSRGVRQAADLLEQRAGTKTAIQSALLYPSILAITGGGALLLLVGVVLPRFAGILTDMGQAMPPSTALLLQTTAAVRRVVLPALIVGTPLTLWALAWLATASGQHRWHEFLLKVPALGTVRLAQATANVAATLSALLSSGLSIARGLPTAAQASGDPAVADRLTLAHADIVHGSSIASSLARHGAMTTLAVQLVRSGEETGNLPGMLERIARLEHERVVGIVNRAVRLLEPGLILVLGGIVAAVAGALLQAMYAVRA